MPVISTQRGTLDEDTVKKTVIQALVNHEKSIWEYYNDMAAVEDNIRDAEWRDLADTILDGLFAAFLSAFLVFTIPQLQPSSTDVAMEVLIHISQQLSNSSTPAYAPTEFTVSPNITAINALFFLSLALVLLDAFLAMLVKSWLQEFDRGWRKYIEPKLRAQERERRLRGLERWKLAELITLLPILIQTSLLLFCAGLIVLLFPIDVISAILSSLTLVAGLTFYGFTTCASIFDPYAPFSSPVSRGLKNIIDAVGPPTARNAQRIISLLFFIISRLFYIPSPLFHTSRPQEHEGDTNPSARSLPEKGIITCSSLPQGNKGVENPHSQIHPQTYSDIVERLATTAKALEDVPVLLSLLDQPAKYPILQPSNVENWEHLVHITLTLLGDLPTFSDSVARTITRNVPFWYDGRPADKQLSRRLIDHFHCMASGQTGQNEPLNSLFAPYLHYCCESPSVEPSSINCTGESLSSTIASLKPSNAADTELLWMVNTIHKNLLRRSSRSHVYSQSLEFLSAVLAYVSSTEQSRRSHVPLTGAIIHAMCTIKSALESGRIHSIEKPYILPGTVLTTSESMPFTFDQIDTLDLWSDNCFGLASDLLRPHWQVPCGDDVWKFQLALITALYIDNTKGADASTRFHQLLKLLNIPDHVIMKTSMWPEAYGQTKLSGYQYMALFQVPLYQEPSESPHFRDIEYVIIQIIERCSEQRMTLHALRLLDVSVKHLCDTSSSPDLLTRDTDGNLHMVWTALDNYSAFGDFNPWLLLHLDTFFPESSILRQKEFEQLDWDDTPEQVHIAKTRLALYDSSQGAAKQLETGLHALNLFLRSKDYAVCTGAFKWCLNLATTNPAIFNPETIGCQQIENFIKVLRRNSEFKNLISWGFLAEYLIPKFDKLPLSWRCDFALVFLFSNENVGMPPVYQSFAEALNDRLEEILPFLATLLGYREHSLTWDQLTSLENWLAQLPEEFMHHATHTQMRNILAISKPHLVEES